MQRTAGGLERLATGHQVDRVVAVAAVRRTTTRRHQPTITQQTQVVRHQALRLIDQHHQLPNGPIAAHQLSQQPPAQRMRRQTDERRRVTGRRTGFEARRHRIHSTHLTNNQSNQIDVSLRLGNHHRRGGTCAKPAGWSLFCLVVAICKCCSGGMRWPRSWSRWRIGPQRISPWKALSQAAFQPRLTTSDSEWWLYHAPQTSTS